MAEPRPGAVGQADGVDHERFIGFVQQASGLGRGEAERAMRAVLETLAERLSAGEARDLALQLPPEVAPFLGTDSGAEPFDAEEFVRRVARREDVDQKEAARHARAVLLALSRSVSEEEFDDMVAELPKSFAPLLPRGDRVEPMPADEFLRRVGERAGLDLEAAGRATAAVLQTLGERISGGEVRDLIDVLPAELHEPLRRGDELSNGAARRMSLTGFVRRVAEREGVIPAEAQEHARAVLATLREALPRKEWLDVTAQLPEEYAAIAARR
jgi:uncharacterized protein (DUF2267 family)